MFNTNWLHMIQWCVKSAVASIHQVINVQTPKTQSSAVNSALNHTQLVSSQQKRRRTDFIQKQNKMFVRSATYDGFLNLWASTAERIPCIQHFDYHICRLKHLHMNTYTRSTQPPILHGKHTHTVNIKHYLRIVVWWLTGIQNFNSHTCTC